MRAGNNARGFVVILAMLLAGCTGGHSLFAPAIPRDQLLAAPDTLSMGGYSIQVAPRLSRDFMPDSPPNGRPLAGNCRLQVQGVQPFPPVPMREAFIWVFNGDAVWVKKASITNAGPYVDIMVSDGPLWGPDIAVDLVLGVRDDAGELHFVQCRDVLINREE
jgi:hypothetical protein